MDIDKYVQRATDMVDADSERDKLFEGIDDMWHGNWALPAELKGKQDMREIIDLSPHDSLKSGTAILSTVMPHWDVQPLSPTLGERDRAQRIAYGIDYNYRRMNQRGSNRVLWDIVHSCLRYDAAAVWLDYLPYQFGRSPSLRQKHALRGGDFAAIVHNPRTVHVQQDEFGINSVLLSTNMTAQAVVNKWGDRTKDLARRLKDDEDTGISRFTYNDLMLYEGDAIRRVIWGSVVSSTSDETAGAEYIIMNDVVETPFMPWIVRVGGSGLESDSKYSVHPLLAPLYLTHKWKDLNVFQSIMQSEIIKYGRTPRVKTITPSGDGVEIDYDDGSSLNLRTGEDADAWKPAAIDPNLKELVDRVRSEVSSATLPRILQNPEFAGNTPFASINAMIQTALGGLNPAKVLCQSVHEEIGLKMVEWCKHSNKPLLAYRKSRKVAQEGEELGSMVSVPPDQLDPESLMITCRIFSEAPTDFAQRLNAAILQNQQLKVPRAILLEEMGRENVDALQDEWYQEQYNDSTVMTDIQMTQQAASAQLQMQMEQAQIEMRAAALQAQGGGFPSNTQGTGAGVPQGQGMNPNTGPTNQPGINTRPLETTGNSGVSTREQVTGLDVTGAPIAI